MINNKNIVPFDVSNSNLKIGIAILRSNRWALICRHDKRYILFWVDLCYCSCLVAWSIGYIWADLLIVVNNSAIVRNI